MSIQNYNFSASAKQVKLLFLVDETYMDKDSDTFQTYRVRFKVHTAVLRYNCLKCW